MEDTGLARLVIAAFLEDLPGQILMLKTYVEKKDHREIELQAHKIRGACASVGGAASAAIAAELERAGKAGDMTGISARMAEMETQFAALREALEKLK